jgi:hypothetical protein
MGAPKLDPHLREVLEDLVRTGPSDGFFTKMQPERIGGIFRAPDEPVSIARAGFSSLERHLVRFHREELALILRKAFLTSFYSVNPEPVYMIKALPDHVDLERDAQDAMNRAHPGCFSYRSGHFLRQILRGEAVTSADEQFSMLVASLRLEDHPHGRLYCAQVHMHAGSTDDVRSIVGPMLRSGCASTLSAAHSYWREAANTDGDFAEADAHTIKAVQLALDAGDPHLAGHDAAGLLLRYFMNETSLNLNSIVRELPHDLPLAEFLTTITEQARFAGQLKPETMDRVHDWLTGTHYEG